MDPLQRLNALPPDEAEQELLSACGSRCWAREMVESRPFPDRAAMLTRADELWKELEPNEWLEAFRAHPRIGETRAETATGARAAAHSTLEQAGTRDASDKTLNAIADGNREYERRFGHIFLVRAAGRSADEILAALRHRLNNDAATELRIAAEEQRQITRLRLERMLE